MPNTDNSQSLERELKDGSAATRLFPKENYLRKEEEVPNPSSMTSDHVFQIMGLFPEME